jgi:hypothetical protein
VGVRSSFVSTFPPTTDLKFAMASPLCTADEAAPCAAGSDASRIDVTALGSPITAGHAADDHGATGRRIQPARAPFQACLRRAAVASGREHRRSRARAACHLARALLRPRVRVRVHAGHERPLGSAYVERARPRAARRRGARRSACACPARSAAVVRSRPSRASSWCRAPSSSRRSSRARTKCRPRPDSSAVEKRALAILGA